MDLNTKIKRCPDIISSSIDNETVLMSIKHSQYFGMNETLSRIWTLAENPIKISDIINDLLHLYSVDKETCIKEVTKVVEDLIKKGIFIVI